jgi:hypothetical protein
MVVKVCAFAALSVTKAESKSEMLRSEANIGSPFLFVVYVGLAIRGVVEHMGIARPPSVLKGRAVSPLQPARVILQALLWHRLNLGSENRIGFGRAKLSASVELRMKNGDFP